ncbi:MAG: hypothetical protein AYL32_015590 [Candidatus Bathyarchaeota archaeon B26-2]|nr:MAG: hypothetical protein AYL32_015590 [Candidatus Bathyarchaeota archaeon B26-2]
MRVEYVAFDSFGVKSSCVKIETGDCVIVIDPGIASETGSFPLTPDEKRSLRRRYEGAIRHACSESEVIVLTHYHYDHHIPDRRLYKDKTLLVKDPWNFINRSQKGRAEALLDDLEADIRIADGKAFNFGSTRVLFSKPLWHGTEGTSLGYVLTVEVQHKGEKILYTSDVDGPVLKETTDIIVDANPNVIILDGPPTYLLGYIMAYYNLARSILNICRLLEETETDLFILDHHALRDYRYMDLLQEAYEKAEVLGKSLCTVAELLGERPKVLEGYDKNGPTRWRTWRPFGKREIIDVLKNAVENKLVHREWLKKARELLYE